MQSIFGKHLESESLAKEAPSRSLYPQCLGPLALPVMSLTFDTFLLLLSKPGTHVLSLLHCPSARRCTLQSGFLHFTAMIVNGTW